MMAAMSAAEDGAKVRCALARTPQTEQAALQGAMVAGVTGGTAPSGATEALIAKLRTRAAACNPGSGASDARIGEIAVASVAVESLSKALQARGVNVLAINGRIGRTPPGVLDAVLARKRDNSVRLLMEDLFAAGGPRASDVTAQRLIGGYAYNAVRLAKLFASAAS